MMMINTVGANMFTVKSHKSVAGCVPYQWPGRGGVGVCWDWFSMPDGQWLYSPKAFVSKVYQKVKLEVLRVIIH